jgi:hypothetical protein
MSRLCAGEKLIGTTLRRKVSDMTYIEDETLECLNDGDNKCKGEIVYRESLSGTGTPIPRCDYHWGEAIQRDEEIRHRYPALQPQDFDPDYCGEVWYEEDY